MKWILFRYLNPKEPMIVISFLIFFQAHLREKLRLNKQRHRKTVIWFLHSEDWSPISSSMKQNLWCWRVCIIPYYITQLTRMCSVIGWLWLIYLTEGSRERWAVLLCIMMASFIHYHRIKTMGQGWHIVLLLD